MNNKEKIEYLAKNYYYRMHQSAMFILNDYHLAEDACQDTMIKLMSLTDHMEDVTTEGIRSLCFVILKNTARDIGRKWHRQIPSDILFENEELPKDVNAYPSDTEDMINDILLLPYHYRSVIALRCLANRTSKETADFLGSNVATVNARLSRAKKILKEKWNIVA